MRRFTGSGEAGIACTTLVVPKVVQSTAMAGKAAINCMLWEKSNNAFQLLGTTENTRRTHVFRFEEECSLLEGVFRNVGEADSGLERVRVNEMSESVFFIPIGGSVCGKVSSRESLVFICLS